MWIGLGATLTFVLLMLIGLMVDEGGDSYVDDSYGMIDNTEHLTTTDPGMEDYTPPASPPPTTVAQQVLGIWQVDAVDVTINGMTYDLFEALPDLAYLRGTTYEFYANGTVAEDSALGYQVYNYSVSEAREIYIAIPGYYQGTINRLDDKRMSVTLPYSADGGLTIFDMTFKMDRVGG
ncbi:MAG: hypothetical protein D6772_13630 [Bacteroidetes bacterium]|nr:MAG: hypothetical protein D6772_13630 [Bacteroidota bacterium]